MEILDELIGERDRLVRKARKQLADARVRVEDLERQLDLAVSGEPYWHHAGNNMLFPAVPIDLSVTNAAFDAVERVASLK